MKKKIKICHITSVHPRHDVRIFVKECISLVENNYDVSLIVADGLGDQVLEGVKIFDVGISKNRRERILKTTEKVYRKAVDLNSNIYHFHDPELMYIGLKLRNGTSKVVYDIHEDLVQQIKIKAWIPKILRPTVSFLFEKIENYVVKKMDALVVPQPYMLEKYLTKNKKTVLVENFVILAENKNTHSVNYNSKICFHGGALTEERGVFNMVNTFSYLDESHQLFLAGNIKSQLLANVKELSGWGRTTYLGVLPFNEMKKHYDLASIGLILYNNVGQYHLSYAIKLFEYMKNSIPVIMPNFGEWVAFNKENQCGVNVDPSNPKEVAKAICLLNENIELKKSLGSNGRKAVLNKYNWDISKSKLIKLYNDLSS